MPVTLAVLLVVVGASEEVLWRGFALVRLAAASGVVPALVLTTAGFAAAHYPALRARGVRIHLLTGAVFATVFVATGSLAGCAAAHALYNLLVVARGGTAPAGRGRVVARGGQAVRADRGARRRRPRDREGRDRCTARSERRREDDSRVALC